MFDDGRRCDVLTFALGTPFPILDRFGDGGWVIVDRRCAIGDQNARVLGPDAVERGRYCLGDGINHLQCDGENSVWVGYFDEGVYGNLPVGSSGLNRFRPRWRASVIM